MKKEKEELQEQEVKERKAERFFSQFANETDFLISVYKVGERGKAILVDKMENKLPDMLEMRERYGGGTYKLYAHDFSEPPKLIDSCVIHVAEVRDTKKESNDRKELLNEMLQMKQILSGNSESNISELIINMVKMQADTNREIIKMINENQKSNIENTLAMERRFTEIIKELKPEKTSISEISEILQFVESIKGTNENSMLDKVLSNPLIMNAATNLLAHNSTTLNDNGANTIGSIIEKIPKDFKENLKKNPTLKPHAISELKKYVSEEHAVKIVDKILEGVNT